MVLWWETYGIFLANFVYDFYKFVFIPVMLKVLNHHPRIAFNKFPNSYYIEAIKQAELIESTVNSSIIYN